MAKIKIKRTYQKRFKVSTPTAQAETRTGTSPITQASTTAPVVIQTTPPITPPVPPAKTTVLFFIQNAKNGIAPRDVRVLETQISKSSKANILYAVLYTAGGDIYSAVKIMRMLQNKFPEIKIIIPDYVYSSGTIMALGGDEIYMDVDASMGPLDKPMENYKDGSDISSIDITKTLTNISSICTSIGISIYKELREKDEESLRLGKNDASRIAFDTAAKLICPITEQIDPFNLQKGYRETTIGLYYAIDMVCSRMLKDDISQAATTCRSLVNDYPSHGYCIFRDELKNVLKLKVKNLEDLPEWEKIKPKYDLVKTAYIRYLIIEDI
jgi:ATP-dependent protease ClpP protease subunit